MKVQVRLHGYVTLTKSNRYMLTGCLGEINYKCWIRHRKSKKMKVKANYEQEQHRERGTNSAD